MGAGSEALGGRRVPAEWPRIHLAEDCELVDHARGFTAKGREQWLEAEKGWVAAFSAGRMSEARMIDGGGATVLLSQGLAPMTDRWGRFPLLDGR